MVLHEYIHRIGVGPGDLQGYKIMEVDEVFGVIKRLAGIVKDQQIAFKD